MPNVTSQPMLIDEAGLQAMLDCLHSDGFEVLGPRLRDDAIIFDTLGEVDDLPRGWTDEQAPGRYRVKRRDDEALFGYAVGPHSWKRFLHPPIQRLWRSRKDENGVRITEEPLDETRRAFIGVRACELASMQIQDKVFIAGDYQDPHYAARRSNAFVVAVNCGAPSDVCFCVSMGAGPSAKTGFDLSLTELIGEGQSSFLVEIGSDAGADLIARIPRRIAQSGERDAAQAVIDTSRASMGRKVDTQGLRDTLMDNLDHPHWDDVASRCLSCANCTMVCPTCFCISAEDTSDLTATESTRQQRWDSCFTMDHSYLTGGSVHRSTRSRYRQWLTHKLATWIDQFGESGCVGCGRCISWCPAGIDLTEEVRTIQNAGD